MKNLAKISGLAAALSALALPAFAQETAAAAEAVAEVVETAPVIDKGDVAWMMTASVLVLFMIVPGLALFYGGLVRTKNMLSVLMQTTMITSVVMIVWVLWGYSFAFGGGTNPFWGGLGKLFLSGVNLDSTAATFTDGVVLPEYVFIAFQMTFAAITPALYVGAFAERVKFSAVVLFTILWVTVIYFPIAHMVWDGSGLIFNWGAIDFAGGTVVHINAGITALVFAFVIGPRIGLGRENMAPHSMTLTMTGAAMLWVGWFGFNAGSNLEATAAAALPLLNTFVATAAAVVSWVAVEALFRGKPSGLGAASGMVAGLVAITPACGTSGPVGAIVLGLLVSPVCYFFVTKVKAMLKYDDSLDVFGVHGVGGMVGAIMTGVLMAPSFGGTGGDDFSIASQVFIQAKAVLVTIVWSGVGSLILLYIVKAVTGLRVAADDERQGLDLTTHGESAYHS
ncbi:ammonium transporter [Rhodobacter maris]|uniref:Ammonium transporter n=1 Tax=Rhodobacter maris TaxID=446682 RepID=A0A285T4A3_9RHOB|nr:ammonium transporter [Rhodobacter maris]SOC14151.1 ammonium transporter [Rhodobacter maris]